MFTIFTNFRYLNLYLSLILFRRVSFLRITSNCYLFNWVRIAYLYTKFQRLSIFTWWMFQLMWYTLYVNILIIISSHLTFNNKIYSNEIIFVLVSRINYRIDVFLFFALWYWCRWLWQTDCITSTSNLKFLKALILNYDKGLIDGNQLKKNIINHMSRINKFPFNISWYHPLSI